MFFLIILLVSCPLTSQTWLYISIVHEKIEQIQQEIREKNPNKHEDNLSFKVTRTISWEAEDVA